MTPSTLRVDTNVDGVESGQGESHLVELGFRADHASIPFECPDEGEEVGKWLAGDVRAVRASASA